MYDIHNKSKVSVRPESIGQAKSIRNENVLLKA
jgi:hypothetical protein